MPNDEIIRWAHDGTTTNSNTKVRKRLLLAQRPERLGRVICSKLDESCDADEPLFVTSTYVQGYT